MKKLVLLFLLSISSAAMAQNIVLSPAKGCPGATGTIKVTVTSPTTSSIGPGYNMTFHLTLMSASNVVLATVDSIFNTGLVVHGKKEIVFSNILLSSTPTTYTVTGTVSGGNSVPYDFTLPLNPADYTVEYPQNLSISLISNSYYNEIQIFSIGSSDNQVIRYFLNGDYTSAVDQLSPIYLDYSPTVAGTYTVKLYDTITSCYSQQVSNAIVFSPVTAVKEAKDITVSVYPNPVVSSITIEAGSSSLLTCELSEINGKLIRSLSFQGISSINMEDLKAGIYILTVKEGDNAVASYKLVK